MEIKIQHRLLEGQDVAIKTAGLFSAPRLLLNGEVVRCKWRRCIVTNSEGREITIILHYNVVDPVPKVEIEGEVLELVPPLKWYEYLWAGLPIFLVHVGGAIGALVGAMAAYSNIQLFRSNKSNIAKYGLSLLNFVVAVIVFFILVMIVTILMQGASPN